jgi:hypothetical protein
MDAKVVFQPVLIILQIVSLQCFYYLGMGLMWGVAYVVFDHSLSLNRFFTDEYINFSTWSGWCDTVCTVLCGISGAYLLSVIVERARRCVDFTFTLHFIHIVSCACFKEFPLNWEWWLMQVVTSVLMATLGEYWCSLQELKDIPAYTRVASTTETAVQL